MRHRVQALECGGHVHCIRNLHHTASVSMMIRSGQHRQLCVIIELQMYSSYGLTWRSYTCPEKSKSLIWIFSPPPTAGENGKKTPPARRGSIAGLSDAGFWRVALSRVINPT